MASALVLAVIQAVLSVRVRANQLVVGIGFNIFALGATTFLYRQIFGGLSREQIPSFGVVELPLLSRIPILGPALFAQTGLVYVAFALVGFTWWLVAKTPFGLGVRAVGENPRAADQAGINVARIRFLAVLYAGATAGLAGVFLSVASISTFTEGMTNGAGYLAVTAVILGGWRSRGVLGACLLFGAATSLQFVLPALGVPVPTAGLVMLPYVLALIAVSGVIRRSRPPAALTLPFRRGGHRDRTERRGASGASPGASAPAGAAIAPGDPVGAFCRHQLDPRSAGAARGPLLGLSFAVKDVFDVEGVTACYGNPTWLETHAPAARTAPAVAALLDAGATLIGLTLTDELALSLTGENAHYGTPINARCPDRVPGGSSSGSAAAVAARLCDFALGTDTGGSVRVPASHCGIFGFRPTHDAIASDGVCPLAPRFDTVGWFARDAATLARVGDVLLAPDRSRTLGDGFAPPSVVVGADATALLDPPARSVFLRAAAGLAEALGTSDATAIPIADTARARGRLVRNVPGASERGGRGGARPLDRAPPPALRQPDREPLRGCAGRRRARGRPCRPRACRARAAAR